MVLSFWSRYGTIGLCTSRSRTVCRTKAVTVRTTLILSKTSTCFPTMILAPYERLHGRHIVGQYEWKLTLVLHQVVANATASPSEAGSRSLLQHALCTYLGSRFRMYRSTHRSITIGEYTRFDARLRNHARNQCLIQYGGSQPNQELGRLHPHTRESLR